MPLFEIFPEDEKLLIVFGNPDLLYIALKNIIENGCKYSENHQSVVSGVFHTKNIILQVNNKGDIISEADLQNIFQPFYRAEDSRSIIGFGVGLPLVSRIIKLHKGQIKISSIVGKGTTFYIQLPVAGNT